MTEEMKTSLYERLKEKFVEELSKKLTEDAKKEIACKLLNKLKENVEWMDSLASILISLGVNCLAIEIDPLFEYNLNWLLCYLNDIDLIEWWLTADPDGDCLYDENLDKEFEIKTAEDLYDYYLISIKDQKKE